MDNSVVGSLWLDIGMDTNVILAQLTKVKTAVFDVGNRIGKKLSDAFVTSPVENFGDKCKEIFDNAKIGTISFADEAKLKLDEAFLNANEKLTTFGAYFSGTFVEGLKSSFIIMCEGIKSSWNSSWSTILNFFTGSANKVVNGLNTIIRGMNAISVDIPAWLGGGKFGFNIPVLPKVPFLAKGGIVSQPTLAMIGERGREAVLPLDNNTDWMSGFASAVTDAVALGMAQSNGSAVSEGRGAQNKIVLEIDGKKFAEAVFDDFISVADRKKNYVSGVV